MTTFIRVSARVVVILLGLYLLYSLKNVIFTLIAAAAFAYPIGWIVKACMRFKPKWLSARVYHIITCLIGILGFIGLWIWAGFIIYVPFRAEINSLSHNWDSYQIQLDRLFGGVLDWYKTLPASLRDIVESQNLNSEISNVSRFMGGLLVHTTKVVSYIVEIVLVPVIAFYFLVDGRSMKKEIVGSLPKKFWKAASWTLRESNLIFENYVIGQIILCVIAGVVVWLGLSLLGIHYALVLGVLAGFTRAVPVIGPIIGAIPIVLLAVAQFPTDLSVAVKVLVFFSSLHLIESKFILPILLGDRLKLHPVFVIVALLIGGQFAGLPGMFLAAPIAAIARVLYRRFKLHMRS